MPRAFGGGHGVSIPHERQGSWLLFCHFLALSGHRRGHITTGRRLLQSYLVRVWDGLQSPGRFVIQGLTTTSTRSKTTRGYDGSPTRSAHKQRTRVDQKEGRTDTREHALSRTKLAIQVRVRNSRTRDAPTGSRPLPRLKDGRGRNKRGTGILYECRYSIGQWKSQAPMPLRWGLQ
jgi:hypothetical protein